METTIQPFIEIDRRVVQKICIKEQILIGGELLNQNWKNESRIETKKRFSRSDREKCLFIFTKSFATPKTLDEEREEKKRPFPAIE